MSADCGRQHGFGSSSGGCTAVYTPPAGKAVVTSVTYDLGTGTAGSGEVGHLRDANCSDLYDVEETREAYATEQHSSPTGPPMPSIGVNSTPGYFAVFFAGYLIPASQLPATATPAHGPMPAHPLHRHT